MVDEYGRWDWPQFRSYVDDTVAMHIVAMKPPAPHNNADGYMWRWSKKGNFNIVDTFGALSQASNNPTNDKWNWVWKFKGPQRICHFIWLVLKERLFTNGERKRRGFTEIDICSLCDSSRESLIHAIRDCHWARTVWLKVLPHTMVNRSGGYRNSGTRACWQPPALGWTKLNVDGAVDPLTGATAVGGVLRSTNGSWLAGFAHNLDICSVTNAELWGLLDGLQIAWSLGINKVKVESDNMSVIQ
ncbi:hypothetical protein K2173_012226 [Erythroxylum novogranatense]|uniref:Uncharacterized protein n=1 Tax=Erythroxylum novogranatense TaxID=1862640 RepID=A0AAV8T9F9_9ROSI|nr:hypothetical protein K2173_012226 [Erythroxylum novogranatense]